MLSALIGGALIGLAATWLWFANGRVAGISGILRGALWGGGGGRRGELVAFVGGLVSAGVIASLIHRVPAGLVRSAGASVGIAAGSSLPVLLAAGVLVGFGTRVGGGCTSGHGVCGLSRWSRRSLVATLIFMGVGVVTVFVVAHVVPPTGWWGAGGPR
jgi:uncharacterized membrane protein YedE/YeeE